MENQRDNSGAGVFDFSEYIQAFEDENTKEEKDEKSVDEEVSEFEKAIDADGDDKETKEDVGKDEDTKDDLDKGTEEKDKKLPTEDNNTEYTNIAKKYLESGIWDDYLVEIDGEEVPLSELEDLDEEKFFEINKAQVEQRSKKDKDNYVDVSEMDDTNKSIIDILKYGGDVSNILKAKSNVIDRLNQFDLDNESHQEALVRNMYQTEKGITSKKQIDKLIEAHKEELDLDEEARGFSDRLRKLYKDKVTEEKKRLEREKKDKENNLKQLRKDLRVSFKDMGVKNSDVLKPILDSVTKKGKTNLYRVDEDFKELKNNPKKFAEYLMWRNNPEDYVKMITQKESKENTRKTLSRLNLTKKINNKKESETYSKNKDKNKDFLNKIKEF